MSGRGMTSKKRKLPDVAVIYGNEKLGRHLQEGLHSLGIKPEECWQVRMFRKSCLEKHKPDFLIVNLEPDFEEELDRVLEIIHETDIPTYFNDAAHSSSLSGWEYHRWLRHLLARINGVDAEYPMAIYTPKTENRQLPENVWILAASIGGPEAVRTFLSELPGHVPAAFILAQHMGGDFLQQLCDQLSECSDFEVKVASDGDKPKTGKVLVAPVGRAMSVDEKGSVRLGPESEDSIYKPCIDQILDDWSSLYHSSISAIVFSGMANDGIKGSRLLAERGGRLWAQSPESCVVSSMAEGALASGYTSFQGDPQELAHQLMRVYDQGQESSMGQQISKQ